jgi:hypothetical protein
MKTALHLTIAAFGLVTFNVSTDVVQAQDCTYSRKGTEL